MERFQIPLTMLFSLTLSYTQTFTVFQFNILCLMSRDISMDFPMVPFHSEVFQVGSGK
jgi:hypothetical protein